MPLAAVSNNRAIAIDPVQRHALGKLSDFVPPAITSYLPFSSGELALSIAKNLALSTASQPLLAGLGRSAMELIGILIDKGITDLRVAADARMLGDAAQNHFSHDLAVGIAGLLMENAGYAWRANGKELLKGKGRKPDYIWSDGTSHQAVVCEVKGATAAKASKMSLNRRAEKGFEEQALPWIGSKTPVGTKIVWGYGIGVHAPAEGSSSCVVHEPEVTGQVADGQDYFVPFDVAAANYAAVFRLLGYFDLASLLTRRGWRDGQRPKLVFRVIVRDDTRLLVSDDQRRRSVADQILGRRWRFAITETAASAVLRYEPRDIDTPDSLVLVKEPRREQSSVPIAPDGLALIGSGDEPVGRVRWDEQERRFVEG